MFAAEHYQGKAGDKKPPAVDRRSHQTNCRTGMYYCFLALTFESRQAALTETLWTYNPLVVSLVKEAYEDPTMKHMFRQLSTVIPMLSIVGKKGPDIIGALAEVRCQQPRL